VAAHADVAADAHRTAVRLDDFPDDHQAEAGADLHDAARVRRRMALEQGRHRLGRDTMARILDDHLHVLCLYIEAHRDDPAPRRRFDCVRVVT